MIWNLLIHLGIDLTCLCGHRRSEHDFTVPTPSGFCQHGDFRDGCSCSIYKPKGLRSIEHGRHAMTPQECRDFEERGIKPSWML